MVQLDFFRTGLESKNWKPVVIFIYKFILKKIQKRIKDEKKSLGEEGLTY
jgi:hypothetical protein